MIIDRLEKIGRVVLWFSIASMCVVVPIEALKLHKVETELRESLRAAESRAAQLAKEREDKDKLQILPLASMGPLMRSLDQSRSVGQLWFTNVSHRAGVVCVHGLAVNSSTQRTSESLPACQHVNSFETVHLTLMFGNGDMGNVCQKGACQLAVEDVRETTK